MSVIFRSVKRALILTTDRQVLLMKIRVDDGRRIWVPPGGGQETGETPAACLRRELAEEVGLTGFELGPPIWKRQHTFNFAGSRYCYDEEYFVVWADRFDPVMSDAEEAQILDEFRWWHLEELLTAEATLTPASLHSIISHYLEHGAPKALAREVVLD